MYCNRTEHTFIHRNCTRGLRYLHVLNIFHKQNNIFYFAQKLSKQILNTVKKPSILKYIDSWRLQQNLFQLIKLVWLTFIANVLILIIIINLLDTYRNLWKWYAFNDDFIKVLMIWLFSFLQEIPGLNILFE